MPNKQQSFFQRLRMPQKELELYYRERRETDFNENKKFKGIALRKKLHYALLTGLAIKHFCSKQKLFIVSDRRKKTDKPIIYASTHIGRNDPEFNCRAIKQPFYFFVGDPRELYRNFDGLLLYINGMICCDLNSKSDRYVAKESCVRLLQQGGNVCIYPEGAWNITENQPVMALFTGTAEAAIRTGAEIIPIAIEQYGKSYYVNIGENINSDKWQLAQKQELTDTLRDALATLKWEIWDTRGVCKRETIPQNYSSVFLKSFEEQMDSGYTMEDVWKTYFHNKYNADAAEVMKCMQNIKPSFANAFLFNKRNAGALFGK